MTELNQAGRTSDTEMKAQRILDAPRELVWKVWTEPEHLKLWWGPDGFTNTIHEMVVVPGGRLKFIMHGPDGTDYDNLIIFKEVLRPEKLVYDHGEEGQPGAFHVTVTFEEYQNMTKLTMVSLFKSKEELDYVIEKYGALEGMIQHLGRLEAYLKGLT